MSVKPITPDSISDLFQQSIPDKVIECWNSLIVSNWSPSSYTSRINQDDAIVLIMEKMNCDRQTVFDKKWLDIESIYRKQGWRVKYDKPGYNESYTAYFEFSHVPSK